PNGPVGMVSPANTYVGLTHAGPGTAPGEPGKYYPTQKRNYIRVVAADDFQGAADAPEARDQAGPALSPLVAAQVGLRGFVVGIGVMTTGVTQRALADPGALPAAKIGHRFEARYAGIAGSLRRDTVAIGVARRLGDSFAVGVSVAGSRVTVGETRRLWAGFDGRDALGDPQHDLEVSLVADDPFVPSAVFGVLVAPAGSPLELGASIGWSGRVHADGTVGAVGATAGPTGVLATPTAAITLRQPWTLRGGVRYLGERLIVEVGADYWAFDARAAATSWQVAGVRVRDPSDFEVALPPVPSRISARSHLAMRGAIDVNVIEGFLWITGGYAFARGGTSLARLSPTFGDLGGHTLALGLESYAGGVTLTFGYARTFSTRHAVAAPDLLLDNPFHAGDGRAPGGSYDGSIDQLGLSLDLEL
ncbi:MAG: hypothetical protein NT062_18620, partial [Proteobacteria bacterium]|nr:hypothetical protein [Pseudomonadota bacterium]